MGTLGKSLRLAALVAAAFTLSLGALHAAPYEFANFNLTNANQPFSFTNAGGILQAIAVPVTFNFTTQTGLSTADHQAILTIAPTPAAAAPAVLGPTVIDQPVPGLVFMTITEVGTGLNLLSATLSGDIVGVNGQSNASFTGQDTINGQLFPGPVVFTSSFGTFTVPGNSYVLGLSTMSAPLTVGPGGIINSFVANIDGQFNANFVANVPEPASIALLAFGLVGIAVATRRK